MKPLHFFAFVCLIFSLRTHAQDTAASARFQMQWCDSMVTMKQYQLCLLKSGPNRNQDDSTIAMLQAGHLLHLQKMERLGKAVLIGPVVDPESDILGIVVYDVPTTEQAFELASQDPAVLSGRLRLEIVPWWSKIGYRLP
jgi:uncharacterized protein YciI